MVGLDKTFPTLDCAACILTPKMVSVGSRSNIHLLSYSEVEEVSGSFGKFKVRIRRQPRYGDETKCTGCGLRYSSCPALRIPSRRVIKLGDRTLKEIV